MPRLSQLGLALVAFTATTATFAQRTAAPALPPTPAAGKPSTATTEAPPTIVPQPTLPQMPAVPGAELDRVVAIVNGDLILDSDVDQELRLDALEPYGEDNAKLSPTEQRSKSIDRLINRDLVLQQAKLQPGDEIPDAAVTKELDALRKNIPACKQYNCETQAGWDRYLAANGFTEAQLQSLWKTRMMVLAFIERRFRMGIKITPEEIKTYYDKTLLPQYAARSVTAPPLDTLSDRIEEVLLARQVTSLLDDWLQSLRAQGSIVVLHPGEEAP